MSPNATDFDRASRPQPDNRKGLLSVVGQLMHHKSNATTDNNAQTSPPVLPPRTSADNRHSWYGSVDGSEETAQTTPVQSPGSDRLNEMIWKVPLNDVPSSEDDTGSAPPKRRSSLVKTHSSFWEDAVAFRGGTVPHSIVLATAIGVVCGLAAFLYYAFLEFMLDFLWHTLPEKYMVDNVPEELHWLWIPLLGFGLAIFIGLSVVLLGEPGDLPYTIKCVHEHAFIEMNHVLPMVGASQFSILAGGSLGPEAPLVAICAALGGWISKSIFGVRERNLIRKHTLMGMAGALAAFFGCPLGGSLFALEVNSRFGVEYFEHTIEAIFCGEVCLAVFRFCARLPIASIWTMPNVPSLDQADTMEIFYGCMIGLLGACLAWLFARFHFSIMGQFKKFNLLDNSRAVYRALAGAVVVVGLGVAIPQTLFWGEYEFQTVWTMSPASTLQHVWPTEGATGFEVTGFWTALILGVAKLVAISFTVSGGYRGGYIFPLFCSGAAFGRAIHCLCPFIPVQLCCLCMAAAMNVAVTRTAIATTLILSYLSGEQASLSSVLAASLVSLFATAYMPFIASQVDRADLETALHCNPDLDYFDGSDHEDSEDEASHKNTHHSNNNDETKPFLVV